MTGHGAFNDRLYSFNLVSNPSCPCGAPFQTSEHILWDCQFLLLERGVLFDAIRGKCLGHIGHADLVATKKNFLAFTNFARIFGERIYLPSPSLFNP